MGCIQSKSSSQSNSSRPNINSSGDTTSQKASTTAAEKGISVHYLSTVFLREAKDAGFNEKSSIYDLEDLSSSKNGLIRRKGEHIQDPDYPDHPDHSGTRKMGCSYVDCLEGRDNVGPANVMLSYSWAYW